MISEPKLHGNAVPEAEFRARILRAVAVVTLQGLPITFATLKAAGLRGSDRRVRDTVETMRRDGLIGQHVLVANRRREPVPVPIDDLSALDAARKRRESMDHEEAAREQSAAWVAEHDARWRRIRRIGEKGVKCKEVRKNDADQYDFD